MESDELKEWIPELRVRVSRGELDGVGPIPADGAGVLGAALLVRIMLADLNHYDDLPAGRRQDLLVEARYRTPLRDFDRLREQIG